MGKEGGQRAGLCSGAKGVQEVQQLRAAGKAVKGSHSRPQRDSRAVQGDPPLY